MADIVKNPRQSNLIFGLGGPHPARPKSLFYVRFKRASSGTGNGDWKSNLGFIVKSVDRPAVQPVTEELHQYNKKRQVHTGYKLQPVKLTLYDTSDSLAMSMWTEYSEWYFGDFRQGNPAMFRYDITTGTPMYDNGNGYGYSPREGLSDAADLNSQFFFDAVEVFQVYGGYYVQYDLINPKITSFDPDDLDYENSGVAMINITLSYEAIIYRNGGRPVPLEKNTGEEGQRGPYEEFKSMFLEGLTNEVPGTAEEFGVGYTGMTSEFATGVNLDMLKQREQPLVNVKNIQPTSKGSGALSLFGNFDFGQIAKTATKAVVSGNTAGLGSQIGYMINPTLGSMIGGTQTPVGGVSSFLLSNVQTNDPVSGALLSAAKSATNSTSGNWYGKSYAASNLVGALVDSAQKTNTTPRSQISTTNGTKVSSQVYGTVNINRTGSAQIGINNGSQKVKLPTGEAVDHNSDVEGLPWLGGGNTKPPENTNIDGLPWL